MMDQNPAQGFGKFGLVLSGGGMRFATHAGVMAEMAAWTVDGKQWLDSFDILVGTSAGALYSALYAVGYTPAHIAAFAPLFARRTLKQSLFDWNYHRAAAALLRHDMAYFIAATSGNGVLTLLDTLLSKGMPEKLTSIYPKLDLQHIEEKPLNEVGRTPQAAWTERRKRRRDRFYYEDLLTFSDCRKELYLLGVNAYTGQKTVFAKVPKGEDKWDGLDEAMYKTSQPSYINDRAKWEKELADLQHALNLSKPLRFPRFENRFYHDFDTALYRGTEQDGPQLPLGLAVRASISVPIFFEPVRIQRPKVHRSKKHEQDVFLDGGVDDNFSLSVAADPHLGNCSHILGISPLATWATASQIPM